MLKNITRRIVSFISAAVLAASNISPVFTIADETTISQTTVSTTEATTEITSVTESETTGMSDTELTYQSIELHPNGEEAEQIITLDGMLPEGAEAEAVDVSEEHDGIAAYDITITDGENEYQPGEENPILVEINDPVITNIENIELWHIHDDGTREQITEIAVEEGKISFFATGFSVYEITENNSDLANLSPIDGSTDYQEVTSISQLDGNCYYIVNNESNSSNSYFLKNTLTNNAGGNIKTDTNISNATQFYFRKKDGTDNIFSIYYLNASSEPVYLCAKNEQNGLFYFYSSIPENYYNEFRIKKSDWDNNFYVSSATASPTDDKQNYWQISGNNVKKTRTFVNGDYNSNYGSNGYYMTHTKDQDKTYLFKFKYETTGTVPDDPYKLDFTRNEIATYGLMSYTDGNSIGYGIASDEENIFAKMYGVDTRDEGSSSSRKTLYITDNVDISEWKFEWTESDKYKLIDSATNKYLKSDGSSLSMTDDSNEATAFKVNPVTPKVNTDKRKRIKLLDTANNKYVSFKNNTFTLDNTGTDLWFVKKTILNADQRITYTADRISVSDGERACDGQEVIIYTRIWNETDERYDFYAINYDGSLKRCYAYGDKLMWMGDSVNTLLWKLSVYTENGKENGYYDLQNQYSGRYLNPQFDGSVTSISKPGLLLPGRTYEVTGSGAVNYGEYFSTILSWDFDNYGYAAVCNKNTTQIEAKDMAYAHDYYFAVINKTQDDTSDELHTVATVDNYDYGIKMKMINFNKSSRNEQNNVLGDSSQWDASNPQRIVKDILSSDLKSDGYPKTKLDKSLSQLFKPDKLENANHLFIQSIHDASGYFEFDSCQNFATLFGGEDNQRKPYTRTYKDEDGVEHTETGYDFTVYRELGTHDSQSKPSLKHGQFYPYNDIDADIYASTNGINEYNALQNSLSDDEPRKYEKLHLINNPDYHFGMELEAKFIQTPSGLDAWGHDVIFEFTGDDDFWLYVDGELVLDLGGIHSAVGGKVNFKTGKVEINGSQIGTLKSVFESNYKNRYKAEHNTEPSQNEVNAYLSQFFAEDKNNPGEFEEIFKDYTEHHMKIFYMERGEGASNLHMRFNISSVTPGNVQFEKKFTSTEDGDLDQTDLNGVQFPIQIMYQKNDEDDQDWYYLTDKSEENTPSVSYQNSTQSVKYAAEYKPPNVNKTYENVFFVVPRKPIEISFPDDAMHYKIVECAVNRDIYNVSSDSEITDDEGNSHTVDFTEKDVIASGNIKDLIMEAAEVGALPAITLKNEITPNSIQALNITKKLYSSKVKVKNNELHFSNPADETKEDKTTFNYRLYLSNGTGSELQLASLRAYNVLDPEYKVCKWNAAKQQFERYTSTDYPNGITAYQISSLDEETRVKLTSHTSPYGSISNIPAGYTVHVPGLLVGTKFMVIERDYEIPVGYKLLDYYCERGYAINDEGGIFKLSVNLEWNDAENPNEQQLVALYKSDNLVYGYVNECSETEDPNTTTFAFNYKESKTALSNADQYEAYEVTVDKVSNISAIADPDKNTLTVNGSIWGTNAHDGDKIKLAVYDENAKLIPNQIMELVYPDTNAVFTFDANAPDLTKYQVHKVNVNKIKKLPYTMNGSLISSYDIDKKYIVDGVEHTAAINSAGTIKKGMDASVTVNNCRGFGIRANKIWSDADFTTAHDKVYTAVYLDDTLLNDTVKCLESPNTTVQYFFDSMPQGKHLSNYGIYEVELTNPVVDENGYVKSYGSLRKIKKISDNPDDKKITIGVADRKDSFKLHVTKWWQNSETGSVTVGIFDSEEATNPIIQRTMSSPDADSDSRHSETIFDFNTPEDTVKAASKYVAYEITEDNGSIIKGTRLDVSIEPNLLPQEYTVSYTDGVMYTTNDNVSEENARIDTIRNARKGGIEINLHEWNNTTAPDCPLAGGSFQLYKEVTSAEAHDKTSLKVGDKYYKLMNTYVSDTTGNITVLYNFEAGNYLIKQTVAPLQHIGITGPITFSITEDSSGIYRLDNWDNPNDTDNDSIHPDEDATEKRDWAEYDVEPKSGVLTAIIDIYNKTYTFDIKKVKSGTDIPLPGARFNLYREVMTVSGYEKESTPLPGYSNLISAVGTGIIPKIDNTLAQGTYYLEEVEAPQGYEINESSRTIRFSITENGIEIENAGAYGELKTVDSLDGSHVTYVISVPNQRSSTAPPQEEYYFDIEKTIFMDKYMHENGDAEQMFLFKIERFALNTDIDDPAASVLETFYVTLNCTDYVNENFTIANSSDDKFSYDSASHKVTVGGAYTFPADIRTGKQHICTKQKGIYKITEVTDWSKTDYEFWKGSNKIKGSTGNARTDGAVVLTVDGTNNIPIACFANSETEYAYLSSQSWAKNSITKNSTS
ncbi:SpaA isopeptide-forming pilin-related protein [Ruminococcus flavefaciens]|uniref:SpaA isopeptide-forming pilin-related protein n=1 Tax=Ruminococcus flavefaciens TaxID=1265 RepID=UPI00048A7937|nr:SpaA isopeptide-forming pilin-related protein [Ruminococcus flavefaciens]